MTNRFMISVAAAALIASSGLAYSQGAGGSAGSAPSAEKSAPMSRDSATDSKSSDKGMKATQSDDKMAPQGGKAEKSAQDSSKTAPAKDMKAEGSQKGMNADTKGATDSKSSTTTQTQTNQKGMNAETKGATDSKSSATTGNAATSATAAPPAEKRTQIVSAIKSEKIQATTNVNFNISIGTRVPTSVRFVPLPPRIVEIYPEWRGYDVILVNGRYVILRPETHEIVYIIEG